jgi:DNA-binding MarR family transcriptional regulator
MGEADDVRRIGRAWSQLRRGGSMLELRQMMYGSARDTPLDVAQGDALDAIIELEPVRMGDLATALRVEASTATRTVARLADAGLATRVECAGDKRGVAIKATANGRRRQARMVSTATETLEEILSVFDPDELRTLGTLMERLVASLDDVVVERRSARLTV